MPTSTIDGQGGKRVARTYFLPIPEEGEQDEENLELLLYEQLKKSQVLKYDIEHYERVGDDHEDHCYTYLIGRL